MGPPPRHWVQKLLVLRIFSAFLAVGAYLLVPRGPDRAWAWALAWAGAQAPVPARARVWVGTRARVPQAAPPQAGARGVVRRLGSQPGNPARLGFSSPPVYLEVSRPPS